MKILVGIQSRSNSTRLPGKIYEKIGEKSVLQHVYDRCVGSLINNKVVESSVTILGPHGDNKLEEYCIENKLTFFAHKEPLRENDLVSRYTDAVKFLDMDAIIRVTSDCWNIQPTVIKEVIKGLQESDYVTTTIIRSFEEGQDVQGATDKAWGWIFVNQIEEREHPFKPLEENEMIRKKFIADGFTIKHIANQSNPIFKKNSIDTKEDLERARSEFKRMQQDINRSV